jgi:hypothetical protein
MAMGMSISQTSDLVDAILNGFAVGVFMYVGILGMMAEELATGTTRSLCVKILIALVGCLSIGLLSLAD